MRAFEPIGEMSLSARRAWIEMVIDFPLDKFTESLSARRAWIEISHIGDSNKTVLRRSPQGERG